MKSLSIAETVEFVSPWQVQVVKEELNVRKSDEAVVRASYSAISAGTELLVYKGEMPTDIPVDEVFAEQNTSFVYPARYGYAMVGTIVESSEESEFTPGSIVFAFREHTSMFVEKTQNLMRVPSGISTMDVCFLPNMETALSIVMDAAILPGESVCVVGQGIVGLLLVSTIRKLHPYSKVVSFDLLGERRRLSVSCAGAHSSHDPKESGYLVKLGETFAHTEGADVSIDVSGSGNGLNTAINVTRNHGRVIIASWFGSKAVTLNCLGGLFHRSHIQLIASQVSSIPASLTGRWSKQRRFQLVWDLLKDISPSSRFPIHVASVVDAPKLYAEVANGDHVQVLFEYNNNQEE